jgi:hypothetical protein
MPDWFMDQVTTNAAILKRDPLGRTYARLNVCNGYIEAEAKPGDYVLINSSGRMWALDSYTFSDNYIEAETKEPVNAAEPVDPEKERLEALDEHYTSLARETKLAYDCFIKAGFHPNDAFTLLTKLMENPVKPPKRSKEDVIREFNKWRAERKERVNNDS